MAPPRYGDGKPKAKNLAQDGCIVSVKQKNALLMFLVDNSQNKYKVQTLKTTWVLCP